MLPFTIMIVLKSLSPRPNQSCQLLCGVSFFSKLVLFLPIRPTTTTLVVQCPSHCQSHVDSAKLVYLGHPLFAIHINNLPGFVCPTQQHCCFVINQHLTWDNHISSFTSKGDLEYQSTMMHVSFLPKQVILMYYKVYIHLAFI